MNSNYARFPQIYYTLSTFIIFFPFLILPGEADPYYTTPKFVYLITFALILWSVFLLNWFRKKWFQVIGIKHTDSYLILFMLAVSISTIFSKDILMSIFGKWHRFEGVLALVSYASLFFFASRFIEIGKYDDLYRKTITGSSIVSAYGILQHFRLDFLPRASDKISWIRSYAFFDNPNFFGSYLLLMIFLCFALYLNSKNRKDIIIYSTAVCIHFAAMIYSFTRSAWLGMFFACAVLSVIIVWRVRTLFKRWACIIVVLLGIFFVINITENNIYLGRAGTIINDADSILSGEQSDTAGASRWYIWRTALPLVKDYFLFGSGPDTFALVFPRHPGEYRVYLGNSNATVGKAHNEYLQIAVTMGVPALIIYLLFISSIILSAWKARNKLQGEYQLFNYGLLASIIGYLVQAFFNISVITVAPYFWIFLGMSYRLSNSANEAVQVNTR